MNNNNFTQEELKQFFYHNMNESEWQKIRNLNADDMIQKLVTPVYQIKYIEKIGYVFILEEDLIMADGTKQRRYLLHHVFDNTDDAKSGIIKECQKRNRLRFHL